MVDADDYIDLDVTFLHATDSAVLIDDGDEEYWLPRRFVDYDGDFETLERRTSIQLRVVEWLAHQRGLI